MTTQYIRATVLIGILVALPQSWAQEPVQAAPGFELIGTREVNEVMGQNIIPGGISGWRMTDPSKLRGLVVSIKATFPPGVTDLPISALELNYSTSAGTQRAMCLAVTLQGLSEKGGYWYIFDPVYPKNLRTEDSPMSFGTAKVDEKEYLTSAVLR